MTHNHEPHRDEAAQAKLTAYALGELRQDEWASVEASLVGAGREVAEPTRRAVEEIRTLAGHLAETARRAPLPPPSPDLREAVEKRLAEIEQGPSAAGSAPTVRRRRPLRMALLAFAAVACLVLAAVTLWLPNERRERPRGDRSVAMHDPRPAETPAADKSRELTLQTTPPSVNEPEKAAPVLARRGRMPVQAEENQLGERLERGAGMAAGPAASLASPAAEAAAPAKKPISSATPHAHGAEGRSSRNRAISIKEDRGVANPGDAPSDSSMDLDAYGSSSTSGRRFVAPRGNSAKSERASSAESAPPVVGNATGDSTQGLAGIPSRSQPLSEPLPASMPDGGQAGMGGGGMAGASYGGASQPASDAEPASTAAMRMEGGMKGKPPLEAAAAPAAPRGAVAMNDERLMQALPPGQQQPGQSRGEPGPPLSYYAGSELQFERKAPGTEQYEPIFENDFVSVAAQPLSTFAIDVDTASYANIRRFLTSGRLPPPDAVRIEEMVNYFHYDYPPPDNGRPFSAKMEVTQCPWKTDHRLVRIGLKGKEIPREQRGATNLVFLIDVSGSMSDADKLPLVKQAMMLLVEQLTEDDRVAIVTYAGSAGLRLESTNASNKGKILEAIQSLSAGGSTHGSAGIQLAYQQAAEHFIPQGTNRVILATDGDLNVGITDDDELVRLIQAKAKSGVFLTVLGFGTGNLKDAKLEKLADRGDGLYAYVDSLREAQRVLVEQLSGSLMTIAKDVKVQVEFNPTKVARYRLIGYENRALAAEDFANDRKDAGEIGAGHTVTALYELVPAGADTANLLAGQSLRYQQDRRRELTEAAQSGELLTLKLRYKEPDGQKSKLLEFPLRDSGARFAIATDDFRFAASVAAFGMLLRHSDHAGDATLSAVEEYAAGAMGEDPNGYRAEFLDLVRRARQLTGQ